MSNISANVTASAIAAPVNRPELTPGKQRFIRARDREYMLAKGEQVDAFQQHFYNLQTVLELLLQDTREILNEREEEFTHSQRLMLKAAIHDFHDRFHDMKEDCIAYADNYAASGSMQSHESFDTLCDSLKSLPELTQSFFSLLKNYDLQDNMTTCGVEAAEREVKRLEIDLAQMQGRMDSMLQVHYPLLPAERSRIQAAHETLGGIKEKSGNAIASLWSSTQDYAHANPEHRDLQQLADTHFNQHQELQQHNNALTQYQSTLINSTCSAPTARYLARKILHHTDHLMSGLNHGKDVHKKMWEILMTDTSLNEPERRRNDATTIRTCMEDLSELQPVLQKTLAPLAIEPETHRRGI